MNCLNLMLEYSSDDICELENLESIIVDMEEELFGGARPDKAGLKQIVVRLKGKSCLLAAMKGELLTDVDLAEPG